MKALFALLLGLITCTLTLSHATDPTEPHTCDYKIPRPKPTHSKPRLATHSKSTLTTHTKPVFGTHSKSTSESAHNNIQQKKHNRKRRNNHNNINRKPVLGTHSKSASDTAHNNMKQFRIVQPERIQNHLYLPQIPYSHSSSHSQQFEPIENHLYVPQMQYSHSSSHSVTNLEEINMQLQPHNHSYGLTQHNLIILALRLNPITDGLHGVNGSPISNPTPTPADTYLTPSNPTPDSHTATPNDAQQPSADAIFLDPTNDPTTDSTPAPTDIPITITHDPLIQSTHASFGGLNRLNVPLSIDVKYETLINIPPAYTHAISTKYQILQQHHQHKIQIVKN